MIRIFLKRFSFVALIIKMKRIEVNKIIVILLSFSFSLPFSIFIPNHVVLRYLTHFLYILNLFLTFAFVFSAAAVVFPVNNVRSRSKYVIHQRNFYFWNHMKMSKWYNTYLFQMDFHWSNNDSFVLMHFCNIIPQIWCSYYFSFIVRNESWYEVLHKTLHFCAYIV